MRFLINDSLIFDDEAMLLFSASDRTSRVRLGSIHSRCFSHLCRKWIEEASIVSKKELFYEGWERHGLVSSNNSLAQTIFQLRRSLRTFDLAHAIVTIPRVGFKLQQVKVNLLATEDTPSHHYLPDPYVFLFKNNHFFSLRKSVIGFCQKRQHRETHSGVPFFILLSFLTLLLN